MADKVRHIGIMDSVSELSSIVDGFHTDIKTNGLVVERIHRDGPPIYSTIELSDLPTLIAVWIFGTYFTEFVKQAGKDHSKSLTDAISRLSKELFHQEKNIRIVSAHKPPRSPKSYSILFSICADVDQCKITFLFKTQCSVDEYESTARAALRFLKTYYTEKDKSEYQAIVDAIGPQTKLRVAYNYNSDSLYIV